MCADSILAAPPYDGFDYADLMNGPSPFPFTLADSLQVDALCSVAGVTVTITGLLLDTEEGIRPFSRTIAPPNTRTLTTSRESIGHGWLLSVRAVATAGTPLLGQLFVWIRRARGLGANASVNATIASGYATLNTDVAWPGPIGINPLDGEGVPLSITVAQPAAGADWSQTVPTGARWKVSALAAQLVTAVAVANRAARIIIDDGTTTLFEVPNPAVQAASLTVLYTDGQGAGGPITSDAAIIEAPIPNDLWLPAGFRIRSSTGAIQAADQWSNIRLLVQEWLEGN